jgi:hypothetical protein
VKKRDLTRFCHPSHLEEYSPSRTAGAAKQSAMSDSDADSMTARIGAANLLSDVRLDDGDDSETDTLIVGIVIIRSLITICSAIHL